MKTFSIQLASIADVKRFVTAASQQPFDIDIVSGRYIIDAKSIMGIFSLDLTKPVELKYYESVDEKPEQFEKFKESISKFIVNE